MFTTTRKRTRAAAMLALSLVMPAALAVPSDAAQGKYIERGRYLVKIGGCNDCHTAGYGMRAGQVPEREWLMGDTLGWRGPWGTTYPSNLRLSMNALKEDDWIRMAQTMKTRPPMPWFTLHAMDKEDLRAIYRYVRHLGKAGNPAPAWAPPEQAPAGPYIQFPAPPKQAAK
ncbi:MAG: cytochrome C [Janthinobacterium lividum]